MLMKERIFILLNIFLIIKKIFKVMDFKKKYFFNFKKIYLFDLDGVILDSKKI